MRRLLVKRFESSFGAFRQSLVKFKKITEDVITFIGKTNRYILDRQLLERIYDIDEEPSPSGLYSRIQQNPDYLEEESFHTKVLSEFEEIKKVYPEVINSLKEFPPRIKVAKPSDRDELFVIIKKGKLFVHYKDYANGQIETKSLEEVIEQIKAEPNTEKLSLSDRFWDEYEQIKDFIEKTTTFRASHSIEQRAINNLKTILRFNNIEDITPLKPFIKTLFEDILDYGTISDYTLRRIANINVNNEEQIIKELEALRRQLGENCLNKEKERLKSISKEVIIAVENRKALTISNDT